MRRVAEVHGANNVWLKRYSKGRAAQQFFFDQKSKQIRSNHWKNYCMEIQSNGNNKNLRFSSTCSSRWWNMFRYQNGFLINERGKAMDVEGSQDIENRNIIMWNKHGRINQQWDLIYADEYPEEPKKGELNKEFGLYVDRNFHIVSEMSSHRYLEVIDNRNIVIKTPNGRNTQLWWFD
jgi:hypothetical protein